jgi:hypothetical protein
LPIAVPLAFVIVHVAISAGGLTGLCTPDHFYPIDLMSKKLEHELAVCKPLRKLMQHVAKD